MPTGNTSATFGTVKSSEKAEALRLERLSFAFGQGPPAVRDLDLSLEQGCFFSLLGPSGCGKTTLLRLIGGYHSPATGRIFLDGRDVTALPPERRDIGMVFQNYALFPHLNARDNVSFGLEMRGVARGERRRRVAALLDRVGLTEAEGDRYPGQLSGGQQQRVAVARALVIEPRLLLLDEPLANLDRQLREQLREELRDIQRRTGVTTLLVTHDQDEALALAHQVGVMRAGRLLQVGTPQHVYRQPCDAFVGRFVGEANLLDVEAVEGEQVRLRGGGALRWRESTPVTVGCHLLLRPEDCVAGELARECLYRWEGIVAAVSFRGADQVLTVVVTPRLSLRVRCRLHGAEAFPTGAPIVVGAPAGAFWVLPRSEGEDAV